MNDELMNFNCSSILPLREYATMLTEFSAIQPKHADLLEFEKNDEKDLDASFINFLMPRDEEEDRLENRLPTVA